MDKINRWVQTAPVFQSRVEYVWDPEGRPHFTCRQTCVRSLRVRDFRQHCCKRGLQASQFSEDKGYYGFIEFEVSSSTASTVFQQPLRLASQEPLGSLLSNQPIRKSLGRLSRCSWRSLSGCASVCPSVCLCLCVPVCPTLGPRRAQTELAAGYVYIYIYICIYIYIYTHNYRSRRSPCPPPAACCRCGRRSPSRSPPRKERGQLLCRDFPFLFFFFFVAPASGHLLYLKVWYSSR